MKTRLTVLALAAVAWPLLSAHAGVSADEAAKLKTELTPFGAERAGNKAGTIPAWTGGFKGSLAGDKAGAPFADPFQNEKPLYAVTAANMAQHADQLTEGMKAMLKKYPDTFRLDVYPTHRTATAPQWVYDNTAKNAVRGSLAENQPRGVYGGIPFPIPKSGEEVMWNHNLHYRPASWELQASQYQVTSAGKVLLVNEGHYRYRVPYYIPDGSPDKHDGYYYELNLATNGPPIRAGEIIVTRQNFDADKSATYVYLSGQRRVRKLPNACCDSPTTATSGMMSYDELAVWSGKTSQFDFKLVGKKEVLIPYNQNRQLQAKLTDVVKGQHLNPDHLRWELHRVWVVEATLKAGERHQAPKAMLYFDEDTWLGVLSDRWDAKGQLWKTLWNLNYLMPDGNNTVLMDQTFGSYNLLSGQALMANVMNEQSEALKFVKPWPTVTFSADGLMAQGVR